MNIIDLYPAPYADTSPSEREAVNVLNSLLDPLKFKSFFHTDDKIPNHDGCIELTTAEQVPIGKLDVQIKKLAPKNYADPKYQCSLPFLSFCEHSILPVLLIVVNVDQKLAYWMHMSKYYLFMLSKKIKGKTVSVRIPKENFIKENSTGHYEQWKDIIDDYKKRVSSWELRMQDLKELGKAIGGPKDRVEPTWNNTTEKEKFVRGFNHGYILQKCEPAFLAGVLTVIKSNSKYIQGLRLGKKEYELEISGVKAIK